MNERQARLLEAIIDEFIATALPVGSEQIVKAGYFEVSGATVRNEMQVLSDEGFIMQPHVSSGRVPTQKGYKIFVREFMTPSKQEKQVRKKFQSLKEQYFKRKDQERVYDAVALLTHMTPNVAFATVPHKDRVYFLGLSHVLRQPEFQENPLLGSGIAEVLEEHFSDVLSGLTIDDEVRYYIGDENVLPQIQSCSLIVTQFKVRDSLGTVGILGPMRMDYAYNTVALDLVSGMLREG